MKGWLLYASELLVTAELFDKLIQRYRRIWLTLLTWKLCWCYWYRRHDRGHSGLPIHWCHRGEVLVLKVYWSSHWKLLLLDLIIWHIDYSTALSSKGVHEVVWLLICFKTGYKIWRCCIHLAWVPCCAVTYSSKSIGLRCRQQKTICHCWLHDRNRITVWCRYRLLG